MTPAIKAQGLYKHFNSITAVDHIDLSTARGQIFGLLGPNAAGKSTTIRLLAGITIADAGSVEILGLNIGEHSREIKYKIGYVAQHFALYPELSVAENLSFYSGLYSNTGQMRQDELLHAHGLVSIADQRAGNLSGGYKRRLSIACAVTHDPDLIFLDEPTAGIDPVTRKELWDLFYDLAAAGKTLFVTTHYMEEAERCNELAFIHQGRLVAQDSPAGIKNSLVDTRVYACGIKYCPELSRKLAQVKGVKVLNQFGEELRIVVADHVSAEQLEPVIHDCVGISHQLQDVPINIEDAFITLTR